MSNRPRILELFTGAGGSAMGYFRAGFDVCGIDIKFQKHYPCFHDKDYSSHFEFHQADALEYLAAHGSEFDAIHASPPCQAYSVTAGMWKRNKPRMIEATRKALQEIGKPYVIENVVGAPLINPLMLCGTMFGLRVIRHRLFEMTAPIYFPPQPCNHNGTVSGNRSLRDGKRVTPCLKDFDFITVVGHDFILADARIAMGIDWMGQHEISQAIPPAYTEFIGQQLIKALK